MVVIRGSGVVGCSRFREGDVGSWQYFKRLSHGDLLILQDHNGILKIQASYISFLTLPSSRVLDLTFRTFNE